VSRIYRRAEMKRRALLLTFALSLPFAAGASAAARPPPARMGMFVRWAQEPDGTDRGGREAFLRAREESLNLPPSSLVALDYFGVDSWAEMAKYNWIPAYWRQKNPARKLIWSIALTMKGTALKEVAAGARDADFEVAAKSIAASQPDAIARIGWEMNGDWFPWSAGGVEADYIALSTRCRHISQGVAPLHLRLVSRRRTPEQFAGTRLSRRRRRRYDRSRYLRRASALAPTRPGRAVWKGPSACAGWRISRPFTASRCTSASGALG